jgi:alkylation response protein AidB-like acyl-CoA dehydrogenase
MAPPLEVQLDLNWSKADLEFRHEVRAFLAAELTPELRWAGRNLTSEYADPDVAMHWQKILHRKGWVAPAWPTEHGGCAWSVTQRHIWAGELAAAGAPPLSPMGLNMCGPALIGCGDERQKAELLPPILSGEDFWCQGYSEAGAGSDLASLQMSARIEAGELVCSGQKLWTTHAHRANRMFCLVRTSREAIPQLGITFLLVDMNAAGITVKPTVSLTGEHVQNEVFFDEVRSPIANVVGRIGRGWTVAKYLLTFERGGAVHGPRLQARLKTLRATASRGAQARERPLLDEPGFRSQFADLATEVEAFVATELRIASALAAGESPGAAASMMKVLHTELSQRLTELSLAASGTYGAAYQPHTGSLGGPVPGYQGPADGRAVGPEHSWNVTSMYFNNRAASIYAGANEIQRNILAKSVLRL